MPQWHDVGVHGSDLLVRGRRVVTPAGVRDACVHVSDGRIERVATYDDVPAGRELVDAGDLVVLPGLVGTHVHVNEPGRMARLLDEIDRVAEDLSPADRDGTSIA
jgi:imidazolonepropionase-like amidohydrolase